MAAPLTPEKVRKLRQLLEQSATKDACKTCDCFQTMVVQLQLDGGEDAAALLENLKPERNDMHGCLGCSPCGPGQLYAQYVRGEL